MAKAKMRKLFLFVAVLWIYRKGLVKIGIGNSTKSMSDAQLIDFLDAHSTRRSNNALSASLGISDDEFQSFELWKQKAGDVVKKLKPVIKPTLQRPLVFFHNRKAGGSTIRSSIFDYAVQQLNISQTDLWIPCHYDVPCTAFANPPKKRKIYGSHVTYTRMLQVLRNQKDYTDSLHNGLLVKYSHLASDEETPKFDCITNLRATVSRVASCWNFRFVQLKRKAWTLPPVENMSPQDWERLLPLVYDEFGNGCNNEVTRIFSHSADEHETTINSLTPDSQLFRYEFETMASRMSNCIIVVNERCKNSTKVLHHYFPWLHQVDLCRKRKNKGYIPKGKLTLGSDEVILKQNAMEELLYLFGNELLDEQLKAVESLQ